MPFDDGPNLSDVFKTGVGHIEVDVVWLKPSGVVSNCSFKCVAHDDRVTGERIAGQTVQSALSVLKFGMKRFDFPAKGG